MEPCSAGVKEITQAVGAITYFVPVSSQTQIEGRLVNLAPGMEVTVEIKARSRRVIDYLLSALLRYKQASLRER